ncbi:hypothetical protein [Brevundimonas sp. 2YAF1]|uniref:hypothetical protein n=1 Tax=Brevundimonas sp. 2YAF1 TaxID=3233024 RepID=UPI003F91AA31
MRRARSLLLLALIAMAPALMATAALAETPSGPQPLSDDELSGLRGGFITTNGFTFGFGVVIRSYVDDRLALQTRLTWTPTGPVTQQIRGDVPGVVDLAAAMTSLVNSGIDLTQLAGTSGGVALVDGNGGTALIHNVTAGQLQNLIVNNANNRNLRQDMELNLYLPDLAAMQSASSAQQRAAQMTYDLNTSLVGSLGR